MIGQPCRRRCARSPGASTASPRCRAQRGWPVGPQRMIEGHGPPSGHRHRPAGRSSSTAPSCQPLKPSAARFPPVSAQPCKRQPAILARIASDGSTRFLDLPFRAVEQVYRVGVMLRSTAASESDWRNGWDVKRRSRRQGQHPRAGTRRDGDGWGGIGRRGRRTDRYSRRDCRLILRTRTDARDRGNGKVSRWQGVEASVPRGGGVWPVPRMRPAHRGHAHAMRERAARGARMRAGRGARDGRSPAPVRSRRLRLRPWSSCVRQPRLWANQSGGRAAVSAREAETLAPLPPAAAPVAVVLVEFCGRFPPRCQIPGQFFTNGRVFGI